jgi:hypothetical protein
LEYLGGVIIGAVLNYFNIVGPIVAMLLSIRFPMMVWVFKFLWESCYPENPINGATYEGELGKTTPLLASPYLLLPPPATEENREENFESIIGDERDAPVYPNKALCFQLWIVDHFFGNSRRNDHQVA